MCCYLPGDLPSPALPCHVPICLCRPGLPLCVYLLRYDDSFEMDRYQAAVARERQVRCVRCAPSYALRTLLHRTVLPPPAGWLGAASCAATDHLVTASAAASASAGV